MRKELIYALIFGGFWTAIVMVFNGIIGYGLYTQWRAQSFLETTGTMTFAEVDRHSTSGHRSSGGGTTYSASLVYQYTVGGRTYTGTRYSAQDWSTSSRSHAANIVNTHRPGTEVTVYYNPDDPADSLLNPEAQGLHYYLLVFMMPFNAVMLGMWWAGAGALWRRIRGTPAAGVRVVRHPPLVNALVHPISPVYIGLGAAGLVGFGMSFVIGFGMDMQPPPHVAQLILLGAIGVGVLAGLITIPLNRQPKRWLTIDEDGRQIVLPAFGARKEPEYVDADHIAAIRVMPTHDLEIKTGQRWTSMRKSTGSHHRRGTTSGEDKAVGHCVVLEMHPPADAAGDDAAPQATLTPAANFTFAYRAEHFARWLADHLRLPHEAPGDSFRDTIRPASG